MLKVFINKLVFAENNALYLSTWVKYFSQLIAADCPNKALRHRGSLDTDHKSNTQHN